MGKYICLKCGGLDIAKTGNYSISFKDKPKDWIQLTSKNNLKDLDFAIKQLENVEKPYAVEYKDGDIIIWTGNS